MTPTPRRRVKPRILSAKIASWTATALLGVGVAGPAMAQFSTHEGFAPDGAQEWRFEVEPYIWLPAVHAQVGLGRAPQFDPPPIDLPRPTIAGLVGHLDGALSCACLVRHGNWSGEVNINYVDLSVTKAVPPVLPGGPGQTLETKFSALVIAPGIGYRVLRPTATRKVSMDARAGFIYSSIEASADFQGTRFATAKHSSNFIQPWIGERLGYYPSPKWRLENTLALTGLGVDGGAIGWNGRVGVSYLVARWLDLSAGYAASQTRRSESPGPRGEDNTLKVREHGPYIATGFRF